MTEVRGLCGAMGVLKDAEGGTGGGELPHTGEVGSWGAVCARRGTTRIIRVHVRNVILVVRPAVELVQLAVKRAKQDTI